MLYQLVGLKLTPFFKTRGHGCGGCLFHGVLLRRESYAGKALYSIFNFYFV